MARYRDGRFNANQAKQRHSTGIPANEIMQKTRLSGGVQRTFYGGLIGGQGAFFFCASLKQMWNVLNAFCRSSHSWEEG